MDSAAPGQLANAMNFINHAGEGGKIGPSGEDKLHTRSGAIEMFRSIKLPLTLVLLAMMLTACAPAQSSPTPAPIVSTIPVLSATAAPATPTQPPATSTATPEPVPTQPPAVPAVLPAPLYFLAPGGPTPQIWRIESDGTTRTQITQEAAGVTDFDAAAGDGSLAYVSGNALIKTDGLGGNRWAGRQPIGFGARPAAGTRTR
jgi:hypothetical protein